MYCIIGWHFHLAVGRSLSFVVFHHHWCISLPRGIEIPALKSFVFLQSLTQLILARASQRSSSSLGLLIPYSTHQVQKFFAAGLHACHHSAFRVWLPSWRFAILNPSEFYFTLTALVGFPLRSILSSKVLTASLQQSTHLLFPLSLILEIAFLDGRTNRSFWAFTLQEELCSGVEYEPQHEQPTPLGFPFLRYFCPSALILASKDLLSCALPVIPC